MVIGMFFPVLFPDFLSFIGYLVAFYSQKKHLISKKQSHRAQGLGPATPAPRLVDVQLAAGGTQQVEVAKAEVLRLNQRHQLAMNGKNRLLEDGLKCHFVDDFGTFFEENLGEVL